MPKVIAVIGALDTKGQDVAFVKAEIERRGHQAFVIDVGVLGDADMPPDVTSDDVAAAGGIGLTELRALADKAVAMETMTKGITSVVKELYDQNKIDSILSLGGTAGTDIGTAAMRALPIGVPKVMVSTVASGDTKAYVGTKDVVMFPSIVDVAGVNRVSAKVYAYAVGAIVGMTETPAPVVKEKPLLAASMFGNTTALINRCKHTMEAHGYEVLVFHATGTGGQTMEALVAEQYIVGVLDLTTTEWADQLCGGVFAAGPARMDAAGYAGIPQIIAPGCLDMVNFWALETVPEQYRERKLYRWNSNVTLMRTTPDENAELGRIIAQKANASKGPVTILLPRKGMSQLGSPGGEFWWPEADEALFTAIKQHIHSNIPVIELDHNINDPEFADHATTLLLNMLEHAPSASATAR